MLIVLAGCGVDGDVLSRRPERPTGTLVVSSLGNSRGIAEPRWVQRNVSAIAVSSDGTLYTNSDSRELAPAVGAYAAFYDRSGVPIGGLERLDGNDEEGGSALAVGGGFVFAAVRQPPTTGAVGTGTPPDGTVWLGVRRFDAQGHPAPFSDGKVDGSVAVVSTDDVGGRVIALAYAAGELYAVRIDGSLDVWDAVSMARVGGGTLPSARALATDSHGRVWALLGASPGPASMVMIGADASIVGAAIPLLGDPRAIAFDAQDRLCVADGARQQVVVYDLAHPGAPEVAAYGARTGQIAPVATGNPAPRFRGLVGVAVDASGTIYAAMNLTLTPGVDGTPEPAGARIVAIDASVPPGRVRWDSYALAAVDGATVDPASDGRVVFTTNARFDLNFWRTGDEARWVAWLASPEAAPDLRAGGTGGAPVVRWAAKRRLLFDRAGQELVAYRFAGDVMIPTARWGLGTPPVAVDGGVAWQWHDDDGDGVASATEITKLPVGYGWGWAIDDAVTVWRTVEDQGIVVYPLLDVSERGVPRWQTEGATLMPMPAPFTTIERIERAGDDALYVTGYTPDRPKPNEWGFLGRMLARYDGAATRDLRLRWTLPLDDGALPPQPRSFAVAGNRLFLAFNHSADVFVRDAETGAAVATLSPGTAPPAPATRLLYGLSAFQRSDGEYLVFHEASRWARIVLYRMPPTWTSP